jgi:hypothetical protein
MGFFKSSLKESKGSKSGSMTQPEDPESTRSITVERTPLSKDFRAAVRKNINIGKSSGVERKKEVTD